MASLTAPLCFEFSGATAKNRLLKAATTECLSTWDPKDLQKRGIPTPEVIRVYERWAKGGYGMIMSGNIMFEFDQLEGAGNIIIPPDEPFSGERFAAMNELTRAAKQDGSLFVAQLSHPGRQVPQYIQPYPISASAIQLQDNEMSMPCAQPRAMEKEDFQRVTSGFAHAAHYCYKAGFDGIELHAAQYVTPEPGVWPNDVSDIDSGYLLAQFLSPTTNKRADNYGGSLENRARLIFEVAEAIRKRVPQTFSLGIKVNSVEFQHGGFSPDECKALCINLEKHGFDYVELSGGNYQELGFSHKRESTKAREAFFLEFAEMIIPSLSKTKVYVTGGLRTAKAMIQALETVDGVGLARPACHDFELGRKLLSGAADGAKKVLLDEQDFVTTAVAAGSQVRRVGHGKELVDMGEERGQQAFMRSMRRWADSLAQNQDNLKFGYADIEELENTVEQNDGSEKTEVVGQ